MMTMTWEICPSLMMLMMLTQTGTAACCSRPLMPFLTFAPLHTCCVCTSVHSDADSDDDEDEEAELMRELEKIKRERAEEKARKVSVPPHQHQHQRHPRQGLCVHSLAPCCRKRRSAKQRQSSVRVPSWRATRCLGLVQEAVLVVQLA